MSIGIILAYTNYYTNYYTNHSTYSIEIACTKQTIRQSTSGKALKKGLVSKAGKKLAKKSANIPKKRRFKSGSKLISITISIILILYSYSPLRNQEVLKDS